jgi:hypothetical protein
MEPMDEPYEHARCFETHDGDVCYEPEPTAEQMRRFADNEAHIAACNVLRSSTCATAASFTVSAVAGAERRRRDG